MRLLEKVITTAIAISFLNIYLLPTSCAAYLQSACSICEISHDRSRNWQVLYSKIVKKRKISGLSDKMMTLITALEHGNPDDIVIASANAANTEGSTLWLAQRRTAKKMLDLLYGVMLVSGNDAAVAVKIEHISGSTDKFAALMTAKAHAIGAANTNFTNSSGLPDPKHYSTALDLSKIAAYGYKNPLFAEIVSTRSQTIPWPGKDHARALHSEYDYCTRMKEAMASKQAIRKLLAAALYQQQSGTISSLLQ